MPWCCWASLSLHVTSLKCPLFSQRPLDQTDLKSLCWRPCQAERIWEEGSLNASKSPLLPVEVAVHQTWGGPGPKKWLPAFSTNAHCILCGCLWSRTISTPTRFLTFSVYNSLTTLLQGRDSSSSSVEFWDMCIWHKFQEVNTLPALSKS